VHSAGRPSGLLPVSAITVATLIIMDATSAAFTDGWPGRQVGSKNKKGAVKAPFFFFGCRQAQAVSLRLYCAAF
jgi:hypothetical protein